MFKEERDRSREKKGRFDSGILLGFIGSSSLCFSLQIFLLYFSIFSTFNILTDILSVCAHAHVCVVTSTYDHCACGSQRCMSMSSIALHPLIQGFSLDLELKDLIRLLGSMPRRRFLSAFLSEMITPSCLYLYLSINLVFKLVSQVGSLKAFLYSLVLTPSLCLCLSLISVIPSPLRSWHFQTPPTSTFFLQEY